MASWLDRPARSRRLQRAWRRMRCPEPERDWFGRPGTKTRKSAGGFEAMSNCQRSPGHSTLRALLVVDNAAAGPCFGGSGHVVRRLEIGRHPRADLAAPKPPRQWPAHNAADPPVRRYVKPRIILASPGEYKTTSCRVPGTIRERRIEAATRSLHDTPHRFGKMCAGGLHGFN